MEIIRPGKSQYETAFAEFSEANFLQSWAWGDANRSQHKIERLAVMKDDRIVALAQIIIKNARRGRYAELAGGPLFDWSDQAVAQLIFAEIKQVAVANAAVFVRFRPQIEDSQSGRVMLEELGAKKSPMHLHAEHTNLVNLEPDEDTLLKSMRRQTRYEVRQADRRGVEIVSSATDRTMVKRFADLQAETAVRQGFIPPSRDEIEAIFKSFGDGARIYEARLKGALLNMALVVRAGQEADYLEAASTPEARRQPGSYALVWQAIRDAKEDARTRFNLWGVAYSDNPKHRYAGVTTFKRGFGGRDVTYLPAHDIVLRPGRYIINWLVETVRRKRRGL